jgi:hypothetical protein
MLLTRSFASEAWLLRGLTGSEPGVLAAGGGRLRFSAGSGTVFDVSAEEIMGAEFPWYYFGGGVKIRLPDRMVRISFVKPNGAEYVDARVLASAGNPAALGAAIVKLADVRDGRELGRHWREVLR